VKKRPYPLSSKLAGRERARRALRVDTHREKFGECEGVGDDINAEVGVPVKHAKERVVA
jgi:hypothetical protein